MPRSAIASLMMSVGTFNSAPRRVAPPASATFLADEEPTSPGRDRPPRNGYILIVDDEADIREILTDVLEAEGYEVRCAVNGIEAFDLLHHNVIASQQEDIDAMLADYVEGRGRPEVHARLPSLILLDLMLPVMNGWKLFHALDANPAIKGVVRIAIMSADVRIQSFQLDLINITGVLGQSVGSPAALLAKPFDHDAFLTKVRALAGPPPNRKAP